MDYPAIWDKLRRGRYKSVMAAGRDAGLIKARVAVMKGLWQELTHKERAEFVAWVRERIVAGGTDAVEGCENL
jgi:hypothetical protein